MRKFNIDVRLIINNIIFWCLILLDWTDLFGSTHSLFNSSYAQGPMLIIGQIAQALGLPFISVADFASFMVATCISLTIYTQGSDLILRIMHKERPWFQWGMFSLSVVISLMGNGAAFYQDMFGIPFPFLYGWWTSFVLGFFVAYGLYSVVSATGFAQWQKMKRAQQAKFNVQIANSQSTNQTQPVEQGAKAQTKVIRRKDLTPEQRSQIYSRKDRKPKVTQLLTQPVENTAQPLVAENKQAVTV